MYKVSAPGSIMLFGEHAVLHSYNSIVCAINRRLTVQLLPISNSNTIRISSNLGQAEYSLDKINDIKLITDKRFLYIINIICFFKDKFRSGFELKIESKFSDKVGFGSSAAVTACTVALILYWLNNDKPKGRQIFNIAKQIIFNTVGVGSGSDLVASIYGGTIAFNPYQYLIQKLPSPANIIAVYSGYKLSTSDVIKKIQLDFMGNAEKLHKIYANMGSCVEQARGAIEKEDWVRVGKFMTEYHQFLCQLGVSDKTLEYIKQSLHVQSNIYGTKISGSGLGDCVIGLGKTSQLADKCSILKKGYNYFLLGPEAKGLEYKE